MFSVAVRDRAMYNLDMSGLQAGVCDRRRASLAGLSIRCAFGDMRHCRLLPVCAVVVYVLCVVATTEYGYPFGSPIVCPVRICAFGD